MDVGHDGRVPAKRAPHGVALLRPVAAEAVVVTVAADRAARAAGGLRALRLGPGTRTFLREAPCPLVTCR